MTLDDRVKLEIGSLVISNLVLQTTLAEAQAKIAQLERAPACAPAPAAKKAKS